MQSHPHITDLYITLLRGINVGGKNKVSMADLKSYFAAANFTDIHTYINSGNILFRSAAPMDKIRASIQQILQTNYSFAIPFALIRATDYLNEAANLPDWWSQPIARRDVVFFTHQIDNKSLMQRINDMTLNDEVVHFGKIAVFWGKYNESEYLKTAYHKQFGKDPAYKIATIRNGNTFEKINELIIKLSK